MKRSKLFILSLFLWFGSFAQTNTVPNNSVFNLFDVLDAVQSGHASGNLSDAFTASNSAYFDATYSGSKNSLLNFRNYHVTGTTPPPSIFTDRYVYSIAANSAVLTARITNYTSPISAYGICYSATTSYPTLADNVVSGTGLTYDGGGEATFSGNITGLTTGMHYFARAYVTDPGGTTYGEAGYLTWYGVVHTALWVEFMPSTYTIGLQLQGGNIAYIKVNGDAGYDPNIQHGTIMGNEAFTSYSWSTSMSFMTTYSYNGYSDWVLPSDVTGDVAAIMALFQADPSFFPAYGTYWTSTDMGGGYAYAYNCTTGTTPTSFSLSKTTLNAGMPVRYF